MAEGALYLERLLVLDASRRVATPATRAWALLEASALACLRGDYSAATGYGRQGQEICAELGDLPGLAWAHRYIGEAALAAATWPSPSPVSTVSCPRATGGLT